MTKSKLIQTVAALFLIGSLSLAGVEAKASEARMAGLMNNPLVLDMTDVVYYPGNLSVYGNTAFLTVFPAAPDGNVGVFIGEDIVFGAWVHRNSAWRDLDDTDTAFTSFELPTIYDLFDLYFGMKNGFGIRMSLSAGLDTLDAQTEVNDSELYSNGESAFSVDVMPGYSLDKNTYHGDFGVGITLNHFLVAIDGEEAYSTGWTPSFLIKHRSVFGAREEFLAWALDVTLTRRAYTAKSLGENEVDGSFGRWLASATVGPRFKFPDNFTIWSGIRFDLEHLSGEIGNETQGKVTGIGVPGLVLSGELLLWDLLTVRAGVDYAIDWFIESWPDADDEVAVKNRTMDQEFAWSTGLGVTLGAFQLDGTVRQQLYFDGPNLLGGTDPGFLAMISATYTW